MPSLINLRRDVLTGPRIDYSTTATVDVRDFGVRSNSDNAYNTEIAAAIAQAAAYGRAVEFQPGTYNRDTTASPGISGAVMAGFVCLKGRAKMLCQDPAYTNNALYFNASSANRLRGLWIKNIDFVTPMRPDVGMANDANELSHFVHCTNVDNIVIEDCRAMHNKAGFVLLRNCNHAVIRRNRVVDVWKDSFHTTGDSHDIWRIDNEVYGPGDDAFATVGYLASGIPTHIFDLGNRVYGGRRGRGFAYVGCRHVRMRDSYFDGRLPADIPQQDVDGYYLRGSCGLYIASESGYQTHGVTDFEGDIQIVNAGPSRNAAKSWSTGTVNGIDWGINSLAPVHLSAGNKSLTDIRINASVQDVCRQFFYVSGGSRIRGLKMNLRGRNNTDGEGWIGAAGVAAATADDDGYTPIIGAGDQLAGELHYLAGDNEVTLDLAHVGSTGPTIGSTSQGSLNLSIKANDVGINLINDIVYQQAGGMLDRLDLVINVDSDLSSVNSHARIDRITDLQGFNGGLSIRMLGRGSLAGAPAASGWFSGPSSSTLTLAGSGSPICNMSTMPVNIGIRDSGGVVTGLSVCKVIRSWAKGCTAVDTGAKTLTISGDVTAQFTTGRHVVFFGLQGVIPEYDLTGANPISAVSYSGGVTTVTLTNAPPALGTFDTVAPVATNSATALPAPYSRFIELMPGRALVPTYTATPNAVIAVPSIQ